MSLAEYRRKRHFGRTREPEPGAALLGERPIFVVQLHHASRRHYDFRLQVGDTLKSWAVPKGPSYDPTVKRMAVEVEDHPLDYASFEGEIPKGEYGGGHVARFDQGVWSTAHDVQAQLAKGHLRFELFGDTLKGGWHLVRSGKAARQPQWLLFKDKDAYAGTLEADDLLGDVAPAPVADRKRAGSGKAGKLGKAAPPAAKRRGARTDWAKHATDLPQARKARLDDAAFEPQLARLGDRPPEGDQWLHEVKWDGYRLVATMHAGRARIWSRNAIEWTDKLPEIRAALEQLGPRSLAVDGELIAGRGTQADFNLLQATLSGEQPGALALVLFDLLHVDGVDVSNAPLRDRKALLERLLAEPPAHLAFSSHIPADGAAAFALASAEAFEGIISKRADRPYVPGRGDDWRKTKRLDSDEFAVVGYTPGKGSRTGFGSLLLARPDAAHGWRYAGRVGSGFSDALIREITAAFPKASGTPSVHVAAGVDADLRQARWFAPAFVVEVNVRGTGRSGVLRQPSFKALRPDKSVADLRDSDRAPAPGPRANAARTSTARTNTARKGVAGATRAGAARKAAAGSDDAPRLTSPGKIVYPGAGLTKRDVADYYQAVMPWLLPEIAGRPLSVIRCPEGIAKPCFFQKHHTAGLHHVDLVPLKEERGHAANYLVANDALAVMELVQFGALELHPWGALAARPDHADRIVFDLDPGSGVPFEEVKRAALHVRDLLRQLKLKSFLRCTGGKGLHVVVPLNPGCRWELVKRFTHGFADALARTEPARFVAVSTLKLRPGKIFVDYLRNSRGATSVASYSLRARAGAPVALPLAWSQLKALTGGDDFTAKDVPALLKKRKRDPWAGIEGIRQDLSRWSG